MLKPLFLALLAPPLLALAQPTPKLTSISPEWIQRGTTTEITLTGENLGGVTQFIFDGDAGLSATNLPAPATPKPAITIESTGGGISRAESRPPRDDKRLVVKITASADASLSPREMRVAAPGGVSNPLNLNVGQWPEVEERAPNHTLQEAQPVDLPAVISGVVAAAAQTNRYRFKAAKGQEIVLEVDAARRGSPLDSSLVVADAKGRELTRSEDAAGLDSLLFFTAPEDGEYFVQLRDYRYRGGKEYVYRLYAGPIPYVESIFPFGGQRGHEVDIALSGRNLAGTARMTLQIDPKAPRGRQQIRAKTPAGYSNLVPFDVSDLTEIVEVEPNDTVTNAQAVTAPIVINGRIAAPKDVDHFKFKSGSDQKLVCDVAASRFGSKLDALLTLTDTNGTVLQQNDDMNGADARLEFDAKKDTEYVIALRDLTDRGGDRFGYRLSFRPPSQAGGASFVARFLPDTLRLPRDGTAKVRCELTRNGGFDGPVRFALSDAPAGVFAEPIVVPNGPASGLMVLSASKDAPLGSFPIRLSASGVINGRIVTTTAEPLLGEKVVKQAYLSVLQAAPFRVDLATLNASLEQGQSATLDVLAERREGFNGEIKIFAEGFTAGRDPLSKSFTGGEAVIKSGGTLGQIPLQPKMDSEVGTRTIIVRGEALSDGQLITQYTQPMPISVSQYPLVLSSTLSRLSVTALPPGSTSAASEAETKIKVERRAGFNGELELALEGLPAGIKPEFPKIAAGASETTLKLVATDKAPTGTNVNFTVVATGVFNDRTYKARTGPIALTVTAPEPVQIATNAPPATATPPGTK